MNETTYKLADGSSIPSIGLGTWKIDNKACPDVIQQAVEMGYRHFDCACDYGNEREVGKGLASAFSSGLCQRDDVWVTSKLWNTYHDPKHVRVACERSLRDLQLDQLDLYLVHFPIALEYVPFETRYPPGWFFDPDHSEPQMKPVSIPYLETWKAMEQLVEAGLVKRIGVCNLNVSLMRELLTGCEIRPVINQVEMHPFLQQAKLKRFCESEGIAITAFSPFGADSYLPLGMAGQDERILDNETVCQIATELERTPAQVVLRWGIQRETVVIPKSQSKDHLRENLSVFDFELSSVQMEQMSKLDRHRRFNDPGVFCEKAFNTFYPIFD